MQAFLFSVVVLLSGGLVVFVSAGVLVPPTKSQAMWAVFAAKILLWLWLLGILYAGLNL